MQICNQRSHSSKLWCRAYVKLFEYVLHDPVKYNHTLIRAYIATSSLKWRPPASERGLNCQRTLKKSAVRRMLLKYSGSRQNSSIISWHGISHREGTLWRPFLANISNRVCFVCSFYIRRKAANTHRSARNHFLEHAHKDARYSNVEGERIDMKSYTQTLMADTGDLRFPHRSYFQSKSAFRIDLRLLRKPPSSRGETTMVKHRISKEQIERSKT